MIDNKFNKYQTQLNKEVLEKYSQETVAELREYLSSVELIKRLIDPYRKRAKDLKRDNFGRIVVDITSPHILEDMDYFRQAAIHYQNHGCYTFLRANKSRGSEYRRFWDEEKRRCLEGYVRPSDGEWISGYYYYYLNYSPIELTKVSGEHMQADSTDGVRAERVIDFPKVWDGDYLWYHYIEQAERRALHVNLLKTRGRGFSFKGASMGGRNYHLLKASKSYVMANEKEYLTKDGTLTKTWNNLDFIANNTPWPRLRLIDQPMHKKSGYKDPETNTERGKKSEVIGITTLNNPDRARGKRGKIIIFEESGTYPNLKQIWRVALKSVMQGKVAFGLLLAQGTGGTEGADFEAAEAFFYEPKGYKIYTVDNVWDANAGKAQSSFFFPEYLNREGYYDDDGNSDVIGALLELLEGWMVIKYNNSDPMALTREKAEQPITPQQAVMRTEGTFFPIEELKNHLSEIEVDRQRFTSSHYVGHLVWTSSGKVAWQPDSGLAPIRDYPLESAYKEGAIEIFSMPKGHDIPYYRYIIGVDPYDDDHSTTSSLGSAFVFDLIEDVIVAEYTGRPSTAEAFYDICLKLCEFYNASIMYEQDKKGLYSYLYNKNKIYRLANNPQVLRNLDLTKGVNYGNKSKGVSSGKHVNAFGRRLLADWMMSHHVVPDNDQPILKLHTIRSIALLKEAIKWNIDGNFDRISSMGILMIYREEMKQYVLMVKDERQISNSLSKDRFFAANLNKRTTREKLLEKFGIKE